jgi:hypothetical protein
VVSRSCPKLSLKYFGPYTILEKIGTMAYKIQLPASAQIHPVFHVSQLKPFTLDFTPVFLELPSTPQLDLKDLEPGLILDQRLTKKGNRVVTQVLIKWTSLPSSETEYDCRTSIGGRTKLYIDLR